MGSFGESPISCLNDPMLIIDGHNLIGAMPDIDLADPDDEWQLVQRLQDYCAGRKPPSWETGPKATPSSSETLIVVFDSGPGPTTKLSTGSRALSDRPDSLTRRRSERGCVTVHFAPPSTQADDLILRLVRRSPQTGRVTVITNDRDLASLVRGAGAQVRSASQFARHLGSLSIRKTSQDERLARSRSSTPDPLDPAFADIYAGFAAADKDSARFGADIDLDHGVWIARLYESEAEEAARAAHWLGRFGGPQAREPLQDALTHRSARVRAAALLALADLETGQRQQKRSPVTAEAMASCLSNDSSSMVRQAAAQALARVGGPLSQSALEAALSDPKRKVRKAAEAGLTQLRARRPS